MYIHPRMNTILCILNESNLKRQSCIQISCSCSGLAIECLEAQTVYQVVLSAEAGYPAI